MLRRERGVRLDGWPLALFIVRLLTWLCTTCEVNGEIAGEKWMTDNDCIRRQIYVEDVKSCQGSVPGFIYAGTADAERPIGNEHHGDWLSASGAVCPDLQLNPSAETARHGRGWRRWTRNLVETVAECGGGEELWAKGGVAGHGCTAGNASDNGDLLVIGSQAGQAGPRCARLRSSRIRYPSLQLNPFGDATLRDIGWRRRTRDLVDLVRTRGEVVTDAASCGGKSISSTAMGNMRDRASVAVSDGYVVGRGRRSVRPHMTRAGSPDLQLYPTAETAPLGRGWRWWTRSLVASAVEWAARAMGMFWLIAAVDFVGTRSGQLREVFARGLGGGGVEDTIMKDSWGPTPIGQWFFGSAVWGESEAHMHWNEMRWVPSAAYDLFLDGARSASRGVTYFKFLWPARKVAGRRSPTRRHNLGKDESDLRIVFTVVNGIRYEGSAVLAGEGTYGARSGYGFGEICCRQVVAVFGDEGSPSRGLGSREGEEEDSSTGLVDDGLPDCDHLRPGRGQELRCHQRCRHRHRHHLITRRLNRDDRDRVGMSRSDATSDLPAQSSPPSTPAPIVSYPEEEDGDECQEMNPTTNTTKEGEKGRKGARAYERAEDRRHKRGKYVRESPGQGGKDDQRDQPDGSIITTSDDDGLLCGDGCVGDGVDDGHDDVKGDGDGSGDGVVGAGCGDDCRDSPPRPPPPQRRDEDRNESSRRHTGDRGVHCAQAVHEGRRRQKSPIQQSIVERGKTHVESSADNDADGGWNGGWRNVRRERQRPHGGGQNNNQQHKPNPRPPSSHYEDGDADDVCLSCGPNLVFLSNNRHGRRRSDRHVCRDSHDNRKQDSKHDGGSLGVGETCRCYGERNGRTYGTRLSFRGLVDSDESGACGWERYPEDHPGGGGGGSGENPTGHITYNEVRYQGIQPLLLLRGGGGARGADEQRGNATPQPPRRSANEDTGAGVWSWLMDEGRVQDQIQPRVEEAEAQGENSADINDDSLRNMQCAVCSSDLKGEDWGWCYCRSRQCGRCLEEACPRCEATADEGGGHSRNEDSNIRHSDAPSGNENDENQHEGAREDYIVGGSQSGGAHDENETNTVLQGCASTLEEPRVSEGHVRRTISLWEGLISHRAEMESRQRVAHEGTRKGAGDDLQAPERVIRGWRNGEPTEVCNGCCRDFRCGYAAWHRCECGRKRCAGCRTGGCECGRVRMNEDDRISGGGGDVTVEEAASSENWWSEARASPAWAMGDGDHLIGVTGGGQEDNAHDEGDRCCRICGISLNIPGRSWRICRCGAEVCVACEGGQCGWCGAWPIHGAARDGVVEEVARPVGDSAGQRESSGEEDHERQAGMVVLTPQMACTRRRDLQQEACARRRERRAQQNRVANEQIKAGLRPPPRRAAHGEVVITCANVTNAGPWENEMESGQVLNRADYVGVQEHRLSGEQLERATDRLLKAGWDCIVDSGYWKDAQHGGGTAALAKDAHGIRAWRGGEQCGRILQDVLKGRFSSGIVDLLGGALIGVFYGISGKGGR